MEDNEFQCELCKKVYTKEGSDLEANKEAEELWGVKNANDRRDMAIICDDCFKKIMKKI